MDTYVTVIATVLTGTGVVFGIWRLMAVELRGMRAEMADLRRDLTAEIRAVHQRIDGVNQRIDAVLLADRNARTS